MSFTTPDAVLTVIDQDHIIKDTHLCVSVAIPKVKDQKRGSRYIEGGGTIYGSRKRESRDSYSNRYHDNGGWDNYDHGGYSERRYANSHYDRKSYDNGRSYYSGQTWQKNYYSDSLNQISIEECS